MKKFYALMLLSFIVISCTNEEKNFIEEIEDDKPSEVAIDSIIHKAESMNGKYIYLTIDDVPLYGSVYIDSVISAEKIKSSIFLVGKIIDESKRFAEYYEMFRKNDFVEIYNHSYSHAGNRYASFYKKPEAVLADFEKNQSEFAMSAKIARLPGRNLWNIEGRKKNYKQSGATSADSLVANGYKVYGWDVEWTYDAKDYTPDQNVDELVDKIDALYSKDKLFTPKHIVLLVHNQMFSKITEKNNLGELITKLKEKDFLFEYLSAYPDKIENSESDV